MSRHLPISRNDWWPLDRLRWSGRGCSQHSAQWLRASPCCSHGRRVTGNSLTCCATVPSTCNPLPSRPRIQPRTILEWGKARECVGACGLFLACCWLLEHKAGPVLAAGLANKESLGPWPSGLECPMHQSALGSQEDLALWSRDHGSPSQSGVSSRGALERVS